MRSLRIKGENLLGPSHSSFAQTCGGCEGLQSPTCSLSHSSYRDPRAEAWASDFRGLTAESQLSQAEFSVCLP